VELDHVSKLSDVYAFLEAEACSLLDRELSWKFLRETEEKHGDTFLVISPFNIYLKTSNAELVAQITARRTDFLKPISGYKLINLYGTNLVSTEGPEWKRHKKITGSAFSEKSNRLVFEESLRQAESMINFWQSQRSNTNKDIKVETGSDDTATLSFNVICAAGFGVPLLWPGQSEDKLQGNAVPGFSYMLPDGRYTMPLKDSLLGVLNYIYLFLLPNSLWVLSECYFDTLVCKY